MAVYGFRAMVSGRAAWMERLAEPDFTELASDAALPGRAMPAADRLFRDTCAACHGSEGQGGSGFPVPNAGCWLWGGDPERIAETLTWGLNSMHPDSRIAEMPVFDRMERGERQGLAGFVGALPWGQADHRSLAATLFEESCESCHGPRGERGLMNGAPSLADGASR